MALENIVKPSTRSVMGKAVVDLRSDATRVPDPMTETKDSLVIHFDKSPNWLSNNKEGGFPDIVVLNDNYRNDWRILKEAWGTGERHELAPEPIETAEVLTAPASAMATGMGK
jgi:hypothetical protein